MPQHEEEDSQISKKQILTRLDDIEEGWSERSLEILELVEDFAAEVFLQQRLAVGGFREFLETSLQFFSDSSINHLEAWGNLECGICRIDRITGKKANENNWNSTNVQNAFNRYIKDHWHSLGSKEQNDGIDWHTHTHTDWIKAWALF